MILPSIIAKNQKELHERLSNVYFFSKFHLDVMDGKFVKNKSLQFNFKVPNYKKFEAHLMVKNPITWIKKNSKKVNTIIVHYESDNTLKAIDLIRKKKKRVGLAINPKTNLSNILEYLPLIDLVLIMTVTPGKYGSKFLPSMLKKVKELRKLKPRFAIEVDGSINPKTMKKARKAGAGSFVVGSYLQKSKDVKKAKSELV